MSIEIKGKSGLQKLPDGTLGSFRLGNNSEQIVQSLHGRLFEQAFRGNVYHASTGTGGVAPGTAIGTAPPFTIYNPAQSGVMIALLATYCALKSGTLGTGPVLYVASLNIADPGGTVLTKVNASLLGSAGVAKVYQVPTLPGSPTIMRSAFSLMPVIDTTAVAPFNLQDQVDGGILVPPGCAVSLQGVAGVGTAPLVLFGMTWEEIAL